MQQDTALYERQLINTQLVAEFDFDRIQLDLCGGYANSQREAPYERSFTYVRTNLPTDVAPVRDTFANALTAGRGASTIAFSSFHEGLWSGGAVLSYELAPSTTATADSAYTHNQHNHVPTELRTE